MIPASLLDTLAQIARILRKSDMPFGGIQVIASGDFYQLPPVPERAGLDTTAQTIDGTNRQFVQPQTMFAFEAACWPGTFPPSQTISLKKVFRQTQSSFVSLLTRLRQGQVLPSDTELLQSCARPVTYTDGVEPVSLMASKKEVAVLNEKRLAALPGDVRGFDAWDSAGTDSRGFQVTKAEAIVLLDRHTNWDKEIVIKVGALVMLLANMQASIFCPLKYHS
jgi:ATP-dependent DNA helicase PIF1